MCFWFSEVELDGRVCGLSNDDAFIVFSQLKKKYTKYIFQMFIFVVLELLCSVKLIETIMH